LRQTVSSDAALPLTWDNVVLRRADAPIPRREGDRRSHERDV